MIQQHINAPDIHVIPKLPPFEKLLTMDYDEIWQDAPAVEAEPHEVTCKQSRETMDFGKVDDYEEDMQAGIRYRACYGIIDERGHIFISDGMHRTESAKHAKVTIDVKVLRGAEEDAEFLASGANKFHGIPRNHADKQRSVKLALKNPEMRTRSNREIARWCGIDDKTVGNWRKKLEASAEIPQMQTRDVTRTGKDGKIQTYQIPIKGTEDFTLSELEQHISGYLAGSKKERESYLHNILNNTIAGQAYLREIESALQHEGKQQGKKWRKADLNKAARKLLDELVYIHCSGTQESGQPCEFVGSDAQMYEHDGKWYCARCFQQEEQKKEPVGDPSVLDNLILQKLQGDAPSEALHEMIFDEVLADFRTEAEQALGGHGITPMMALVEEAGVLQALRKNITRISEYGLVEILEIVKKEMDARDEETEKLVRCDNCKKLYRADQIAKHNGQKLHTDCYYAAINAEQPKEPENPETPAIKDLCSDCEHHRSRNNSKHGKTYGQHYHGKCIREGGFCEDVVALIEDKQKKEQHEPTETAEEPTLAQEYQRAISEIIRLKRDEGLSVRSITLHLKEHGFRNDKGHVWSKSAIDRMIQQARKEGVEL